MPKTKQNKCKCNVYAELVVLHVLNLMTLTELDYNPPVKDTDQGYEPRAVELDGTGFTLVQLSAVCTLTFLFFCFFLLLNLGGREDSPIRLLMMQHQPWPAQVN